MAGQTAGTRQAEEAGQAAGEQGAAAPADGCHSGAMTGAVVLGAVVQARPPLVVGLPNSSTASRTICLTGR